MFNLRLTALVLTVSLAALASVGSLLSAQEAPPEAPSEASAGDAQKILAAAVAAGAVINRFEIHEPSLEEIFIEEVKKSFGETEAVEA